MTQYVIEQTPVWLIFFMIILYVVFGILAIVILVNPNFGVK